MKSSERAGAVAGSSTPPELREMLVCPLDHGELDDVEETLVCRVCGRVYPVVDGVPDMLVLPVD